MHLGLVAKLVCLQPIHQAEDQDQEGDPLPKCGIERGSGVRRLRLEQMEQLGSLCGRPEGKGEEGGQTGGQRRPLQLHEECAAAGLPALRLGQLGGVGQVLGRLWKRGEDKEKEAGHQGEEWRLLSWRGHRDKEMLRKKVRQEGHLSSG